MQQILKTEMGRERNNLTLDQAQKKYNSKMLHLSSDMEYVKNLTTKFEQPAENTGAPIKRGKILIETYKLSENIRSFLKFTHNYARKYANLERNTENEEILTDYRDSVTTGAYQFKNDQEKKYIMKAVSEQITIDKGRNMERYRLRQKGLLTNM
jgi:hypothetical protein